MKVVCDLLALIKCFKIKSDFYIPSNKGSSFDKEALMNQIY